MQLKEVLSRNNSVQFIDCQLWLTALKLRNNLSINKETTFKEYEEDYAEVIAASDKLGVSLSQEEYAEG